MPVKELIEQLQSLSDPAIAARSRSYFKLGKGEYAEGDKFLGLRVAQLRTIGEQNRHLNLADIITLLGSVWHEARLLAVFMLVDKYRRSNASEKQQIFAAYLDNTRFINNWDIVDSSAPHIVGESCFYANEGVLEKLACSDNLWERRIAVLATFYFIRQERFQETLMLAEQLLEDKEDLMHKACGWMLREIGKRNEGVLLAFLDSHARSMPRTMLRYALEKTAAPVRQAYMQRKATGSMVV